MENKTFLTVGEAAELCGWAKSSISKAIKSGELSVYEKTKRGFKLDPAEVLRVFPEKTKTSSIKQIETHKERIENSAIQVELEALRKQLSQADLERNREREQLTERIESLQTMLSEEKSERRQLTAQLTDQRERAVEQPRRRFFGLFRG